MGGVADFGPATRAAVAGLNSHYVYAADNDLVLVDGTICTLLGHKTISPFGPVALNATDSDEIVQIRVVRRSPGKNGFANGTAPVLLTP